MLPGVFLVVIEEQEFRARFVRKRLSYLLDKSDRLVVGWRVMLKCRIRRRSWLIIKKQYSKLELDRVAQ